MNPHRSAIVVDEEHVELSIERRIEMGEKMICNKCLLMSAFFSVLLHFLCVVPLQAESSARAFRPALQDRAAVERVTWQHQHSASSPMSTHSIPAYAWKRDLNQEDPETDVHTHFKPYFLEALALLPVAFRIGSYIHTERSNGKEPIFDLNGITLSPPHPGPHAGVPLGGLGGGAIGRGFRGEFRRWSLQPGKYHHHVVAADILAIRVRRGYTISTKVLSLTPPSSRSCLSSWSWDLDPACGKYYAVFPYAWTVFDDPVPNLRVTVKQLSPFLPGDYASSSLPAACLSVEVENKSCIEDVEVSVMFCFQNGTENADWEMGGDWPHFPFQQNEEGAMHGISGVCMPHRTRKAVVRAANTSTTNESVEPLQGPAGVTASFVEDRGSYAIAAETTSGTVTVCSKFITMKSQDPAQLRSPYAFCTTEEAEMLDTGDETQSAKSLWKMFRDNGDIRSFSDLPPHRQGALYGSAVCIRKLISRASVSSPTKVPFSDRAAEGNRAEYHFALAWDHPVARFGSGLGLPRYYSRFFGSSGMTAPLLATFALQHRQEWDESIRDWQCSVLQRLDQAGGFLSSDEKEKEEADAVKKSERQFYRSQVFNELYYLVDGGTLWTDSCAGHTNQRHIDLTRPVDEVLLHYEASIQMMDEVIAHESATIHRSRVDQGELSPSADTNIKLSASNGAPQNPSFLLVAARSLEVIAKKMADLNAAAQSCGGDQRVVGQFLYLEGHEYLMYNTYDVHFYASFSLLMLWPQLELSLQRDFAAAVPVEDSCLRRMMGEGTYCERKAKNFLPHDLGSPSEEPWRCLNAYNFQDVSKWKDLGTKFVLQVYRDFLHLDKLPETRPDAALKFLEDVYPAARTIMREMESFDTNKDGMIENSGFPDQTYDIWTATGVHAYCGGLWITACEAMAAMATLRTEAGLAEHYRATAQRARKVYMDTLWNGQYLKYDSSASAHHDSIMSDMLAGQWFAHVCRLPPTIAPAHALSCFRTIYQHNVLDFGEGKLLGAVNGMRPATSTSKAQVDNSCIQSREVWTGTTYAVAAAMLMEASNRLDHSLGDSAPATSLTDAERAELVSMAFNTARGIHEAGWQEFGYWFATPEAWTRNGNYRSMGYMRALCIWAMQYAMCAN